MDTVTASRIACLAAAALLFSACTSTNSGSALEETAASVAPSPAASGGAADYCPQVTLREGTGTLTEESGGIVDYVASISETSRDCSIVDGQLRMRIGVAGRLTPGSGGSAGSAELPIRVAIVRGDDVLYSHLGRQTVAIDPASEATPFVYVDDAIAIPEPAERNIVIYTGFDEGPPAG